MRYVGFTKPQAFAFFIKIKTGADRAGLFKLLHDYINKPEIFRHTVAYPYTLEIFRFSLHLAKLIISTINH